MPWLLGRCPDPASTCRMPSRYGKSFAVASAKCPHFRMWRSNVSQPHERAPGRFMSTPRDRHDHECQVSFTRRHQFLCHRSAAAIALPRRGQDGKPPALCQEPERGRATRAPRPCRTGRRRRFAEELAVPSCR